MYNDTHLKTKLQCLNNQLYYEVGCGICTSKDNHISNQYSNHISKFMTYHLYISILFEINEI